ncbi:hypothetical protein AB6A40_003503 [Gnathostoma spinigerum]|uniref:Uncharacterized protein n=1 Tax=Gnathostoma spinigerum TaxID=75299 RepID=A0ABD6EFA4_9BILA
MSYLVVLSVLTFVMLSASAAVFGERSWKGVPDIGSGRNPFDVPIWRAQRRVRQMVGPGPGVQWGGNWQGGPAGPSDPWGNTWCDENTIPCIQHNFRLSGDKGVGLQLPSTTS